MNEPQAAVSEHTHEPWTQDGCRVLGQSIHGEPNGKVVAITGVGLTRQADSRRIVACVNACAGIPTEELEGKMLADQQAALADALDALEIALQTRCDERKCSSCEDIHDGYMGMGPEQPSDAQLHQARAVLAHHRPAPPRCSV